MNILHLSDIHFGRNYECYDEKGEFDKKAQILEDLIKCIKYMELKPEHIVVTGDIAWHGKLKEFEEASVWFKQLLESVNLMGKDITFCVGNHDANRGYASTDTAYTDESIKEIDEAYKYGNVHRLEAPIYAYNLFCEEIGVEPFKYPLDNAIEYSYSLGYKDVKFPSGSTLRLLAFNTALLSTFPEVSEEKMWIGQAQIQDLIEYGVIPVNGKIHYSIALLHHAERFLHPNEICQYDGRVATMPLLKNNVDLILCGHTETGGRPVLQKQLGGGTILTAGATYYSDTHPNAFSMLFISDNEKAMCFQPYVYNDGWKVYDYQSPFTLYEKLKQTPEIGRIDEMCKLVMEAGDDTYEVLMGPVTIHEYKVKEQLFWQLTNERHVLRKLDIKCKDTVQGGAGNLTVELAPKMERNVTAILEHEKYLRFLADGFNKKGRVEYSIKGISGKKYAWGNLLKKDIKIDTKQIEFLEKLKIIEVFYDIKFWRPDKVFKHDADNVELLLELIEKGYTRKLHLLISEIEISELEEMERLYSTMQNENVVYLNYIGNFTCDLFGVKFDLRRSYLVSGEYEVDLEDLKRKIETYEEGDERVIKIKTKKEFTTFFITDSEKAKGVIDMHEESTKLCLPFMELNLGMIKEKPQPK